MNPRAFPTLALAAMGGALSVNAALPDPAPLPPVNVTSNQAVLHGSITLSEQRSAYVAFQVRRNGALRWVGHTRWQRIVRLETFAPGQDFFATVKNLRPKTSYEVRPIALVAGVRRNGNLITFHTPTDTGPPPPTPRTGSADEIALSSARLNGTLTQSSADGVVLASAFFEFGTGPHYGSRTPATQSFGGEIYANVAGLSVGTDYHFRLVSSNAADVRYGADAVFRTRPCPAEGSVAFVTNSTEAILLAAIAVASEVRITHSDFIQLTHPIDVVCPLKLVGDDFFDGLSGGNVNRLFNVKPGQSLTLENLTIVGGIVRGTNGITTSNLLGETTHPGVSAEGGAVLVSNASFTALNCTFRDCAVIGGDGSRNISSPPNLGAPGGNALGGVIMARDSVITLSNCLFLNNIAVAGLSGLMGGSGGRSNVFAFGGGGSLAAVGGTTSIANCFFRGNSSTTRGGAVYGSSNSLAVELSTFIGNQAVAHAIVFGGQENVDGHSDSSGGAIAMEEGGRLALGGSSFSHNVSASGGALYHAGIDLTIRRCEFIENQVRGSGSTTLGAFIVENAEDGKGGAIAVLSGEARINECDFYANQARGGDKVQGGGPGSGLGGALYCESAASITNCTFGLNAAAPGQPNGFSSAPSALGGAVFSSGGNVVISFSTIASNSVTALDSAHASGGGIHVNGGTLLLANSILSGNFGNINFLSNIAGSLTDGGHNISSDGTANLGAVGSLDNTDPLLGPLIDDGGSTLTFPLLDGSPAIDAADPLLAPATDQRGVPRPQGPAPDIGGFERQ